MQGTHRRQIRNYLLDRKFQLRYTLVIVLVSGVLSAGLGYFWYDEMRNTSHLLEVQALGTMQPPDAAKIREELQRQDDKRLAVLVGFWIVLAGALSVYGIVFTHKVAGPIFKIQRHFRDIGEGRFHALYNLRRRDHLKEFWAEFCEMNDALRKRTEDDVKLYDQLLAAAEEDSKQGTLPPSVQTSLQQLRELRDQRRTSLGAGQS